MKAFEYVSPTTVAGAVGRLAERPDVAQPLAGGMDLLGMMKDYVATPERLVALKDVDSLYEVGETDSGSLRIGAMVTLDALAADDRVRTRYPALVQAAGVVGTPQIRNRGTLGGNLCQRPRCWYFRSELFPCLRKGGSSCFAIDGDNRFHAIFDNNTCPIVHPSNCAVPLVAYGATVHVAAPESGGEGVATSSMAIGDFFVRPSRNVRRENALATDQIVTHVELPAVDGVHSASYVVKHKQSHDWPLALASVAFELDGDTVSKAAAVLGAVAPTPWRSGAAEQALIGQTPSEETAEAAAAAAIEEARPLDHNGYKVRIARTALKRAVLAAAGMATGNP